VEKEADRAFTRAIGMDGATRAGHADDMSADNGFPARDAAGFAGHSDNVETMSPKEKARQLPRRMWFIVAAGMAAWTAVIAIAYLFLA
jgi:hypothetical protein